MKINDEESMSMRSDSVSEKSFKSIAVESVKSSMTDQSMCSDDHVIVSNDAQFKELNKLITEFYGIHMPKNN